MNKSSIVIVGSCNIDLITYTNDLPRSGETIFGKDFKKGFGGKGANQAIMAGRLGAQVEMIAKVGSDSFGKETLDNFKSNNISTNYIKVTDKAPSGIATIIVDGKGSNIIIVVSGANNLITLSDIEDAKEVIQNAKILICQLEVPVEITTTALRLAHSVGVMTILNTAPALSSLPEEIYSLCDILCLNETETEILTGIHITNGKDSQIAGEILLKKGANNVIITLGSEGSVLVAREKQPFFVPSEKVEQIKDTTGAGDCYIGSLAFYLYHGKSIEESMKKATQICAIKVQGWGTQTSFPYMKDLDKSFHV